MFLCEYAAICACDRGVDSVETGGLALDASALAGAGKR